MGSNKQPSHKKVTRPSVWSDADWTVVGGQLVPRPGRPKKVRHLFTCVAEKLPFASLSKVERLLKDEGIDRQGVYMAHDSMGVARYGGRGNIFSRLRSHRRNFTKQLIYYSFYVIENKNHEREIETAILRAAGAQMTLNERKVGDGIHAGSVTDYEPGTYFVQRQGKRGKKHKTRKKRT